MISVTGLQSLARTQWRSPTLWTSSHRPLWRHNESMKPIRRRNKPNMATPRFVADAIVRTPGNTWRAVRLALYYDTYNAIRRMRLCDVFGTQLDIGEPFSLGTPDNDNWRLMPDWMTPAEFMQWLRQTREE